MDRHPTPIKFTELDLAEPLLKGVQAAGFTECTPIQARTLPHALGGADVAGQAQTGTGKTAAFLLATFQRLLMRAPAQNRKPSQPRALVIAPTRELALQIGKDAEAIGKFSGQIIRVVYGGESYERQRDKLREGVDVLIGTPGRLIDYHKQRVFDLRAADVAVMDEADRMFDLGFIRDVRYLLRRLPPPEARLTMLFSATLSYRVMELAYEHMNNPELIRIEPDKVTADRVRQIMYMPSANEKIALLIGLLKRMDAHRTMVFVNTKRVAEQLSAYLEGNHIHARVLSGDVPQRKRLRYLRQFQEGELPVLVTTDVASRGLHVPDVSHVFNFDLPQDAEDYVHRIGRTARAGAEGDAISFACEEYAYSLPDIEEFIGHAIPRASVSEDLLADVLPPAKQEKTKKPHPKNSRQRAKGGRRKNPTRRSSR